MCGGLTGNAGKNPNEGDFPNVGFHGDWKGYEDGGIYMDVDVSHCAFRARPFFLCSVVPGRQQTTSSHLHSTNVRNPESQSLAEIEKEGSTRLKEHGSHGYNHATPTCTIINMDADMGTGSDAGTSATAAGGYRFRANVWDPALALSQQKGSIAARGKALGSGFQLAGNELLKQAIEHDWELSWVRLGWGLMREHAVAISRFVAVRFHHSIIPHSIHT